MRNKNVIALLGNHEQLILSVYNIQSKFTKIHPDKLLKLAEAALIKGNGCLTTIKQLNSLSK